jgi:hypothetical protein
MQFGKEKSGGLVQIAKSNRLIQMGISFCSGILALL